MHQLVEEFEWLIAAELVHPSLVAPIATGTDGIVVYLARDFVASDSLDVVVRDDGPTPLPDAVRVATQLAEGLDFAAAVGILHGALHPRDVLISPNEARLTDVGVSQALDKLGVAVPVRRPYSAPERVGGDAWGRPADVFGLASLTHEMLWGKRPTAIGAEAAEALTEVPGAKLDVLRAVFAQALAEDPARRFETAIDFAAGLKSAISGVDVPIRQGDSRTSGKSRAGTDDRRPVSPKAPRLPLDEPEAKPPPARPSPGEIPLLPTGSIATSGNNMLIAPLDDDGIELGLRPADNPRYVEVDQVPVVLARESEPEHDGAAVVDAPIVGTTGGARDRGGSEPRTSAASRSPVGLMAASLIVGVVVGFGVGFAVGTWRQPVASSQVSSGAAAGTEVVGDGDAVRLPPSPERGVGEPGKPDATNAKPTDARAVAVPPKSDSAGRGARTTERGAGGVGAIDPLKPGRLLVRSSPAGARVYVDGAQQGATPATVRNLARGVHRVRVVLEGYVTEERRITISAAQSAQSVIVELGRPRASSAAQDRTTLAPANAVADTLAGALIVESKPTGAEVFVDGKLRGTTPLVIRSVDAGEHVLRLERAGYRRWSSSITVVAGERNRLTASLER